MRVLVRCGGSEWCLGSGCEEIGMRWKGMGTRRKIMCVCVCV